MIILITGCQRSGTKFYAEYLAKKHTLTYINEGKFNYNDLNQLLDIIKSNDDLVIQCPTMKTYIPLLIFKIKKMQKDVKVYWMWRDFKETKESMTRIEWLGFGYEIEHLKKIVPLNKINTFESIIEGSYLLGNIYQLLGLVKMVNMESLRNLEGFKKHGK